MSTPVEVPGIASSPGEAAIEPVIDLPDPVPFDFLSGGGEMRTLIRSLDWSKTSIGPIESWSPTLRTMVSFLLANRFPLLLWWGPQYASIYNDAYRPILGRKHPKSMGQAVSECWEEIWHVLQPLIDTPFSGGPATWMEDLVLEINRHGFVEETHFTVAYSPVPDETAARGIGGVLATVHEITEKVIGERRVAALRDLGARAPEARTAVEACALAAETLSKHAHDVPFALLYVIDPDGRRGRLAGAAGIGMGDPVSPLVVELAGESADLAQWPLAKTVRTDTMQVVEDLGARFARGVPRGPWSDPPHTAVMVPIKSSVPHQVAGVLVAGVSPRLRLDEFYRGFFELVSTQIAAAIASARAYEEERKRAEALAEIDRAKTLFFSNVSHEFRTPLTLMLGPIEDALGDPALPEHQRGRLQVAQRNSLRLLKLVNSLLDFSRIEAGRMQASYEPVDLAALTSDLASSFRSAIERAGLKLVVDCPALPEWVYVDRDMWEKIVLNLLSNALKFTFEGQIVVRLRAVGDAAELTIQDTGTGIPEQELPRLFERFHRIEGQKSRTYEGSGIGLALVQELVNLHGGSIHAESVPRQGTSFIVGIPFGTAHLPPERIGAERTLASTSIGSEAYVSEAIRWLPDLLSGFNELPARIEEPGPTAPLQTGARILLADDNADMRDYVRRLLASHWNVETVADGQAALESIRRGRPDLVLADVMMPRLDGFGLLRAIRDNPLLRDLPVIMLSARAGEEAKVEGLEGGADDYLIKPFSARELIARINANLELARIRREAVQTLRESEERFRALVNASAQIVWTRDTAGAAVEDSPSWRAFSGQTYEQFKGFGWLDVLHPDDIDRVSQAWRHAVAQRARIEMEYRIRHVSGEWRWTTVRATPVFARDGSLKSYVGMNVDITDRRRAQEQQTVLLREMSHRVKNLFAVTGAVVALSARSARTPADLAAAIQQRLGALARAHELTRPGLISAGNRTSLGTTLNTLIQTILAAFVDPRSPSILFNGHDVPIGGRATTNLALVVHELTTNAIKYGALSSRSGVVHIDCTTENGELLLVWMEQGGPALKGGPTGEGFGSSLIRGVVIHHFGGRYSNDWRPEGLIAQIAVPMDRLDS